MKAGLAGYRLFAADGALPGTIAVCLVSAGLLLGGGGSPAPHAEMWLQTLALIAAIIWIWTGAGEQPLLPRGAQVWLIAGIIVLLPVLQLLPLPPSVWQALPGRGPQAEALALIGEEGSWRPLSLAPLSTLASLLSLIPPLLLLMMVAAIDAKGRQQVIVAVAVVAVLSAFVGAMQLAGGELAPRFYAGGHTMGITGFHANRNAAADVLLIGIIAVGVVAAASIGRFPHLGQYRVRPQPSLGLWLFSLVLILLLALAVIFTGSRTSIALIPLAFAACWIAVRSPSMAQPRAMAILAGGSVLLIGLVMILWQLPSLQWVTARFAASGDPRFDLWRDGLHAAGLYWPAGSGIGTFTHAILPVERIEAVDATVPNRAHNDYLELLVEAGATGIAALLAVGSLLAALAWRAWHGRTQDRAQVIFGLAVLAILGLHSLVDYPLRSMALACLAGTGVGMLAPPPGSRPEGAGAASR